MGPFTIVTSSEMDIDRLEEIQQRERTSDALHELSESFYTDIADRIRALESQRAELLEDSDATGVPEDVQEVTEDIRRIRELTQGIYERRVGKLVRQASPEQDGPPPNDEKLTPEERALLNNVTTTLEETRTRILNRVLSSEADTTEQHSE